MVLRARKSGVEKQENKREQPAARDAAALHDSPRGAISTTLLRLLQEANLNAQLNTEGITEEAQSPQRKTQAQKPDFKGITESALPFFGYWFFAGAAGVAAMQASMALRVATAHLGKARDSTYSTASESLPATDSWNS